MASLNKVFLAGNLTRDPELRYTPGGTAVAQFGMAVNRKFKNREGQMQEEATFVDIEVWGRQAETASEYLGKGSGVLVEGRLKLDSWESKQTGEKRSKLRVVGERVQFLGARREGGKPPSGRQRPPQAGARPGGPGGPDAPSEDVPDELPQDEDIPPF
jgi:single-strand DNA-binding protein